MNAAVTKYGEGETRRRNTFPPGKDFCRTQLNTAERGSPLLSHGKPEVGCDDNAGHEGVPWKCVSACLINICLSKSEDSLTRK